MTIPMRRINIEFVPLNEMRFTTLGDWWETVEGLEIRVVEAHDWRYEVPVLFHELIEFFWCKWKAIGTEVCDNFDRLFEEEYAQGKWTKDVEAGDDPRCPYRRGHKWGTRFERLTCWVLAVNWKTYCDYWIAILTP